MKSIIALLLCSSSISGVKINSHNKSLIVSQHKIHAGQKGIFTNMVAEVESDAAADNAENARYEAKKQQLAEAEKEHEKIVEEEDKEQAVKDAEWEEKQLNKETEKRYLLAQKRQKEMMDEIDHENIQLEHKIKDEGLPSIAAPDADDKEKDDKKTDKVATKGEENDEKKDDTKDEKKDEKKDDKKDEKKDDKSDEKKDEKKDDNKEEDKAKEEDPDKMIKKEITDRNGDKVEKEVHANISKEKPTKNSPLDMIPHEKAKLPAISESPDKILPHFKRPRQPEGANEQKDKEKAEKEKTKKEEKDKESQTKKDEKKTDKKDDKKKDEKKEDKKDEKKDDKKDDKSTKKEKEPTTAEKKKVGEKDSNSFTSDVKLGSDAIIKNDKESQKTKETKKKDDKAATK